MKKVYLQWLDSEASNEWTVIDEINEELELTETVGWLIKETDQFYLLALSYDKATNSINNYKKIPRCAVVGRPKILKI